MGNFGFFQAAVQQLCTVKRSTKITPWCAHNTAAADLQMTVLVVACLVKCWSR
jgi:hypothetical protein